MPSLRGMPPVRLPSPKLIDACLSSFSADISLTILSEYHTVSQQPVVSPSSFAILTHSPVASQGIRSVQLHRSSRNRRTPCCTRSVPIPTGSHSRCFEAIVPAFLLNSRHQPEATKALLLFTNTSSSNLNHCPFFLCP